jgi:hypothetical protein
MVSLFAKRTGFFCSGRWCHKSASVPDSRRQRSLPKNMRAIHEKTLTTLHGRDRRPWRRDDRPEDRSMVKRCHYHFDEGHHRHRQERRSALSGDVDCRNHRTLHHRSLEYSAFACLNMGMSGGSVGKLRIRPLHGLERFLGHIGGCRLRSNLRVLPSRG